MKLLALVTPPFIYHGCSTWKTFLEGKFTGKKILFLAVDMKICGRRNVRKHKEIRGSDKYVTLDISSKFDSLDKMKITFSESKVKLERSGKGLITYLGFRTKARSQNYKKARYVIVNVSEKDLSRIIKYFEKLRNYLMRSVEQTIKLLKIVLSIYELPWENSLAVLEVLILVCTSSLTRGTLSTCRSDTPILGSGHVWFYPLDTVPTHPRRALGFAARGSTRGELSSCMYYGCTT